MKIQTRGRLGDYLDEDLAWRKIELVALKKEVDTSTGARQSALLRGGIAMLYAHWEGYVKAAATGYLNYVSMQGLRYRELAANFLGLAIKGQLDSTAESRKARIYTQVAHVFATSLDQRAKLPYDIINTEGNLSIEVFLNILCIAGIPDRAYVSQLKPVVERLVYLRNNIAHGRSMRIDLDEYHRLHAEVMNLLNVFKSDIEIAADTNAFRR